MKLRESQQVQDARRRRAWLLSRAVLEWQRLAEQQEYPRSLVDICEAALIREYRLGRARRSPEAP